MSAHMQSKAHLDALVTAAITLKIDGIHKAPGARKTLVWAHNGTLYRAATNDGVQDESWCSDVRASDIGQMLWAENKKSVEYRYSGDPTMMVDWEYDGYEPTRNLNLAELCMAIDGYMYQSCEHPEWLTSSAYAFCIALKAEALSISTHHQRDNVNTWSLSEEMVRKPKDFDDALTNSKFLGDDGIHIRATSGPVALVDWMLAGGTDQNK